MNSFSEPKTFFAGLESQWIFIWVMKSQGYFFFSADISYYICSLQNQNETGLQKILKFPFKNPLHYIAAPVPSMYSQQKVQSEDVNFQYINVVYLVCLMQFCCIYLFIFVMMQTNLKAVGWFMFLLKFLSIWLFGHA